MKTNLPDILKTLKLHYINENHEKLALDAARMQWPYVTYLEKLIEGEFASRQDKAVMRRVAQAKFPVRKSIDDFQWTLPTKINKPDILNLFRMKFLENKENVIFLGGVGLGKSHIASALGFEACAQGFSVLFATAIDIINTLQAAQRNRSLRHEILKYCKPQLLIIDELGFMPIDKNGCDLLFQVISARYEQASTVITSNRPFKNWSEIFNNDPIITSAILDRVLHHSHVITISGPSFRMKNIRQDD